MIWRDSDITVYKIIEQVDLISSWLGETRTGDDDDDDDDDNEQLFYSPLIQDNLGEPVLSQRRDLLVMMITNNINSNLKIYMELNMVIVTTVATIILYEVHYSYYYVLYEKENKCVLSQFLKVTNVDAVWMPRGRLFCADEPGTCQTECSVAELSSCP